jgi:hypothetical protein
MDRDNGVEFVDDNRVDMRSRAFEVITPPTLDGNGSAASMQNGYRSRCGEGCRLTTPHTPSMRRPQFAIHAFSRTGANTADRRPGNRRISGRVCQSL